MAVRKAVPTTLKTGETVVVTLRRQGDGGGAWEGRVLDLDAVAIRLAITAHRGESHGVDLGWLPSDGIRVVPWSRIEHVRSIAATISPKAKAA